MFIHTVLFWLPDDLGRAAISGFEAGLEALIHDSTVQQGYYGPPADTHRAVIENSYSYGLVVMFKDKNAHDQYQVSPVHAQFLADHASKWTKISVIDIESG